MANRSKARGTAWEVALVAWLKGHGWPNVERRALQGSQDMGDVAGIPGVVIEAKDATTLRLYEWCDEARVEAARAGARYWYVAVKRYGTADPGRGYAVLPIEVQNSILRELIALRAIHAERAEA